MPQTVPGLAEAPAARSVPTALISSAKSPAGSGNWAAPAKLLPVSLATMPSKGRGLVESPLDVDAAVGTA
jgi:hypothetical protein